MKLSSVDFTVRWPSSLPFLSYSGASDTYHRPNQFTFLLLSFGSKYFISLNVSLYILIFSPFFISVLASTDFFFLFHNKMPINNERRKGQLPPIGRLSGFFQPDIISLSFKFYDTLFLNVSLFIRFSGILLSIQHVILLNK